MGHQEHGLRESGTGFSSRDVVPRSVSDLTQLVLSR